MSWRSVAIALAILTVVIMIILIIWLFVLYEKARWYTIIIEMILLKMGLIDKPITAPPDLAAKIAK
jgi:hypothetical protein